MNTLHDTPTQADKNNASTSNESFSINLTAVIPELQNPDPQVFEAAVQALEAAVSAEPKNPLALYGLGIALAQKKDWKTAREYFERSIAADPKFAAPHSSLGNLYRIEGNRDAAEQAYRHALLLQPSLSEAHYNLSLILDESGKEDDAEESLKRAILFRPAYPEAHNNIGHILLKRGKTEQALSHFRQALVWNPDLKQARTNLILALYRLSRTNEAGTEVEKALEQWPDDPSILRTQAAGLAYQGLLSDAQEINRKILKLEPDAADVQLNMGELMASAEDYEGALSLYRKLLARKDIHPVLSINAMGNVLFAQGNFSEARDMFRQGLMLDERLPTLTMGLGKTLVAMGDLALGIQTLRHAADNIPTAEIHSLLIQALRASPQAADKDISDEKRRWVEKHCSKIVEDESAKKSTKKKRSRKMLRIGLLVSDIENRLVAGCLETLFRHTPADKAEYLLYQSGGSNGKRTARIKELARHWQNVSTLSTGELKSLIYYDDVDILIDTVGHAPGTRLPLLAQRAAALQGNWLGSFACEGVPETDFILCDDTLFEDNHAPENNLRVANLPALAAYLPPADAPDPSSQPIATTGHITFGSLSPMNAINPLVMDTWAEILGKIEDAHLVILSNTAESDENSRSRLRKLLMLRDVAPERIEVLPRLAGTAFWETLGRIDIMLDTFPIPLGLAAIDCLWMGVPVLTMSGKESYQRTTLSFLHHAGLGDEWVANDRQDYISRAILRAGDIHSLEKIREQSREALRKSPVLDGEAFATGLVNTLAGLGRKSRTHK